MKRAALLAPFVLLMVLSATSHWINGGRWLGNCWALTFFACLFFVPVYSRRTLWLGYVALLFPFVVLGLQLAFGGSLSIGYN